MTATTIPCPTITPVTAPAIAWEPGRRASPDQLHDWCERFHEDGYLVLHDVLTSAQVAELKRDLEDQLSRPQAGGQDYGEFLRCRLFEASRANLDLFDLEPIVSFAEALVAPDCHVVHNNGFRTPSGTRLAPWHQDDAPHFLVTHGEAPTNIRLPVLLFTANFYLTDVSTPDAGPTVVVPGSHRFGRPCPKEPEETPVHTCGPAGSVVLFNNQTWHCSGFNSSGRDRLVCQVSYARRLVGHKYHPFMNYRMPDHVIEGASPRRRRLLGFLDSGAYG